MVTKRTSDQGLPRGIKNRFVVKIHRREFTKGFVWLGIYLAAPSLLGVIDSISFSGDLMVLSPNFNKLPPTEDADIIRTFGSSRLPLTLTGMVTRLPLLI